MTPSATPEHAALFAAVLVMLGTKLSGGRCRPYSFGLRIRVLATGLATYPDAAVVCGDPERDPESPTHVTNPTLVVEVLSPGTEDYDRGEKREHYQRIEALRDYVLVAQDRRRVEVFSRDSAHARFEHRTYEAGETATLRSMKITFGVTELYDAAGLRG